MSSIIVTLAQAGGYVAAVAEPVSIPEPRQQAASYFHLFKLCACGHSSAWHSGAFGDAWRAGEQVAGGCEAAEETSSTCGCISFRVQASG